MTVPATAPQSALGSGPVDDRYIDLGKGDYREIEQKKIEDQKQERETK